MFDKSLPSPEPEGSKPSKRIVKKTKKAVAAPQIKTSVLLADLPKRIDSWIKDCKAGKASQSRLSNIRYLTGKLVWWMQRDSVRQFDADAVRDFLTYIQDAHTLPEGRWGESGQTRQDFEGAVGFPASMRYRPVSSTTISDYRRILTAFCNWMVSEGILSEAPTRLVKKVKVRRSEVNFHVFEPDEVKRILGVAKEEGKRDYAIALFLLDTGIRASELIALNWNDLELDKRKASILNGKGEKPRSVYWSSDTGRALWAWGSMLGMEDDMPVFPATGGRNPGERLQAKGLYQMCQRWGKKAMVKHCHPHTFRHTYATCFLLAGGSQITLMDLMGHSNLEMTRRYVRFTGVHLAEQARLFSPVTMLKKKR
jgi:integrase